MLGINWKYKLHCATINLENRTEDEETAVLENWYLFNHSLLSVFQRADLTSDKDLYLDNSSVEEASGVYPIDDDDYSSGSGSGEITCHKLIFKSVRNNAIIWGKYSRWILWMLCYLQSSGHPCGLGFKYKLSAFFSYSWVASFHCVIFSLLAFSIPSDFCVDLPGV